MADPPFGFGLPGGSGSSGGRGGSGGSGGSGGDSGDNPGGNPLGPLGDPQQFADALRQFADLMAWQGGPVNWDLAKNVARQTVAAEGDPSVLDADRKKVVEAIQLADLWLNEATSFPSGVRTAQAWSRSEWVEATLPVWSQLCDPIAEKAVDALGGMISGNPEELGGELPAELSSALQAVTGGLGGMAGLGGLGAMMKRIGGMMVGGQTGAAVGGLAREVVSSTDVGLPLGPEGVAALLPAGVADFGQGLSVSAEEIRIFLALREAAHHRLFAHVPWLRSRLLAAVEDYARGITVDAAALREAMPQIDPSNPEALREALSDAACSSRRTRRSRRRRWPGWRPCSPWSRAGWPPWWGRRGRAAAAGRRARRGHPAAPGHRGSRRAHLRHPGRAGTAAPAAARGGRDLAAAHRRPRVRGAGRAVGAPRPDAHGRGLRRPGRVRGRAARAGHVGAGGGNVRAGQGDRRGRGRDGPRSVRLRREAG